jgi:alkanesulfonate monooxygenase SsuD/methylene tetrahydromethanopterin reductase-like flavin-dependent oxidoreductase (luciferase family)
MDLRIFVEPQQGASYEGQLAGALLAEHLGFDAYFRSDHYLAMHGDGLPGPTDSWITLAGLARETSTIRLGTLVSSVTFRRPGPLAISVAQVDAMSRGRIELGLGTGWFEAEHAAYGIPFPEKRFGVLEEQLEVITGLWSTRRACEELGRDPDSLKYSVALPTLVGTDEKDYQRRAADRGRDPVAFRDHNIAGTPSEALDKISRLGRLGADRVYLQTELVSDLDLIELLGVEVLPHVS